MLDFKRRLVLLLGSAGQTNGSILVWGNKLNQYCFYFMRDD